MVVQQVLSATFDPALRYTVLPATLEGGADRGYVQGSEGPGNFQPVFRIPIEDEIPGSRPKWKRLPQLLDDPTARRMLRDVGVQNASTIVADDEEAVEYAEGNRWHREEIHGRNRFPMVSKEGQPTLGPVSISRRSLHPARDRSLRKFKTEHAEFP